MKPVSKRRSNKLRRAESTHAVEKAACRLFVERGFRSTSMDLIAREVGMTKGAIYFYYKDKNALLLHILKQSQSEFSGKIFSAIDDKSGAPSDQIDIFLDTIIWVGGELDQYLLLLPVVMATEFKGRGDDVETAVKDIYEQMYQKLSDVIISGQNNGEFGSELPTRSLATMIVALTDGLLLEIYRQSSAVSGKEIGRAARVMVTNLLERTNGVKAPTNTLE